ncbi:WD40 repeat-like protein [Suillus hirtellus]|nr:WD40 repeat-like protein [Suillus hirtellus]
MPYRKIEVKQATPITNILHLPGGQRIIILSQDGSFRIWDLETGTQVKEWEDKFSFIALSPDGKTLVSRSLDGAVTAVKLWSIDTGKVIKTLTGHTDTVPMCWSPDGGQVLGISARSSRTAEGSQTFRVWDVKSGETIVGPIKAGGFLHTVCYSPDGKVIATAGDDGLKIWDASTGKLLKTLQCHFWCLAWTLNGKILTTWGRQPVPLGKFQMMKFDTATWAVLDVPEDLVDSCINSVLPSPDGRFFATISVLNRTAQLWNIETNQPIGTPLHHEHRVYYGTFSADGKFLFTNCQDNHIYIWDVSAIFKEADLSDIVILHTFHSK